MTVLASGDAAEIRPVHRIHTFDERYDPGGGGINVARMPHDERGGRQLGLVRGLSRRHARRCRCLLDLCLGVGAKRGMLGATTMRRCTVLAAPLLLAACVMPERWQKIDASHATTAKDISECQSAARQEALRRHPYGLGSPTVVAAGTVVSQQRDETFCCRSCIVQLMHAEQRIYPRARTGEIGCPVVVGQEDENAIA